MQIMQKVQANWTLRQVKRALSANRKVDQKKRHTTLDRLKQLGSVDNLTFHSADLLAAAAATENTGPYILTSSKIGTLTCIESKSTNTLNLLMECSATISPNIQEIELSVETANRQITKIKMMRFESGVYQTAIELDADLSRQVRDPGSKVSIHWN